MLFYLVKSTGQMRHTKVPQCQNCVAVRCKGKSSVPGSTFFNAARTKPTVPQQPFTLARAIPKRRGRPRKDSAPRNPEEAYVPQNKMKAPNLDESSNGKRLFRRRGISKVLKRSQEIIINSNLT